jgi:hypothetical protein
VARRHARRAALRPHVRWTALTVSLAAAGALGLTTTTLFGSVASVASTSPATPARHAHQVPATPGTMVLEKANKWGRCWSTLNLATQVTTNVNASCLGSDLATVQANAIARPEVSYVTLTNASGATGMADVHLLTGYCHTAAAPNAHSHANFQSSGRDVGGFCNRVRVTIERSQPSQACLLPAQPGPCPLPDQGSSLTALGGQDITLMRGLGPGQSVELAISTELGTSANNADQGLAASMPLTYRLVG